MPDAKDVMIAIMGAAVALAGLLLVFAGFVFSQASTFPPENTDDETITRYENAGKMGLLPFVLALADAAVCLCWLLWRIPCLFPTAAWGFFLLLLLTAGYGAVLLLRYL